PTFLPPPTRRVRLRTRRLAIRPRPTPRRPTPLRLLRRWPFPRAHACFHPTLSHGVCLPLSITPPRPAATAFLPSRQGGTPHHCLSFASTARRAPCLTRITYRALEK